MGYLPRDLLMSQGFVRRSYQELTRIAVESKNTPPLLVGVRYPPIPRRSDARNVGKAFHKTLLPTYDVFDEDRYFEPANEPGVLELNGWRLGISICEDVWNDRDFWKRRRYHHDPIEVLANAGEPPTILQSFSTISRTRSAKPVLCRHPSTRFAFEGSPCSTFTSDGRYSS